MIMMTVTNKSIFDTGCQVLVNPVNTKGVMGAGLAKAFKARFPENFKSYRTFALQGGFNFTLDKDSRNFLHTFPAGVSPQYIVNLATKDDYRGKSDLQHLDTALEQLFGLCEIMGFDSVALPKLGCGLGGLDWRDVKPLIEERRKLFSGQVVLCE